MPEEVITDCPYCNKEFKSYWDKGLLSRPLEYLLIADWIFHTDCWDKLVEENPTDA